MLEFLNLFNEWIKSHKELVTVIGVPAITYLVTSLMNKSSERRAANERHVERVLARELKLSEFRQNWINELRLDFSQYLGILASLQPISKEETNRLSLIINKILLRMNHHDPDFKKLTETMTQSLKSAESRHSPAENPDLIVLMGKILKREWERLKQDLSNSESGGKLT